MPGDQGFRKNQHRHWRRSLLVGAGLLALYFPLDLRQPEGIRAASCRAIWVVVLLVVAALQRPENPRLSAAGMYVGVATSGLFGSAVVLFGGGTTGARFGFLLALPLSIVVLLPELTWGAVLIGMGCLAGGIAVIARDGRDFWFALEWGVLSFAVTVLAVLGCVGFRRVWLSELSAQRAQGEALARLAESERKRAHAERLASVGRLAAGVAHEINNPLSFVKANLQYLQHRLPPGKACTPDEAAAIAESLQGATRIAQIVGDMRSLARSETRAVEPFSAAEAVEEAWRLASVRLGAVRARWRAGPDLPLLRGAPRLLVQSLVNLLANAAEAAETASDPSCRWVSLSAFPRGGGVALVVEDGGPGLPPEVLAHLFEPFFSTKGPRGTGLGLALVREQVTACGGTVEAENRPEGGARFTVWLPAAGVAPAAPAGDCVPGIPPGGGAAAGTRAGGALA